MKNVLIYGWYGAGNIGDDLFEKYFRTVFDQNKYNLNFVSYIKKSHLNCDIVILGGGSFLDQKLLCEDGVFEELLNKKIFYIGVGAETNIHTDHLKLLKNANIISIRNEEFINKIKNINPNVFFTPDLVYGLEFETSIKKNKSILIILNASVVPKWNDPHWKHASWITFKTEFGQALDELGKNYTIDFFPMCHNKNLKDDFAAIEIINFTENKNYNLLSPLKNSIDAFKLFSEYEFIITQRYHGIVLAEILKIPYLSIYHHDKLKTCYPNSFTSLFYYGINKNLILSNIEYNKNNFKFKDISLEKVQELKSILKNI